MTGAREGSGRGATAPFPQPQRPLLGPAGDHAKSSFLSLLQAAAVILGLSGWQNLDYGQEALVFADPSQVAPGPQGGPAANAGTWPGFRGLGFAGICPYDSIPTSFDVAGGKNIRWKAQLSGGNSSPIVWGDNVIVTGSDGKTDDVYCFEAKTGKEIWKQSIAVVGELVLPKMSAGFAAPTPATDGQRVYAIFASGNLAAFDLAGKAVWSKNIGPLGTSYGYASSPVLAGKLLILQLDLGDKRRSHLLALDSLTGKEVWRKARPIDNSWTTPLVVRHGARDLIVTAAKPHVIAYDSRAGIEVWRTAEGLGDDVSPSPVCAAGVVVFPQTNQALAAVRLDGSGDVQPAWATEGSMPAVCSPVTDGRQVIVVSDSGVLQSFDIKNGKKLWERDLDLSFYASPSLVGEHLFLFTHDKTSAMVVVPARKDDAPPVKSELGEACSSSPAFTNGCLYIRGSKTLFCIGKTAQ